MEQYAGLGEPKWPVLPVGRGEGWLEAEVFVLKNQGKETVLVAGYVGLGAQGPLGGRSSHTEGSHRGLVCCHFQDAPALRLWRL